LNTNDQSSITASSRTPTAPRRWRKVAWASSLYYAIDFQALTKLS
jgi:hypothetical protein